MRIFSGFTLPILFILLAGVDSQQQVPSSRITVYIFPPESSSILVGCWTNATSSSSLFNGLQNFSYVGEFTWTISYNSYFRPYDAYWCRARWGTNVLPQFSVYGDSVARSNSEWLINESGKRRVSLDSKFTNDLKASWFSTTHPEHQNYVPNYVPLKLKS